MHALARFAGIVLIWTISGLVSAEAQTVLRWKLQPNQTLHYEIGQDVTSSFTLNGQPMQLSVAQTLDVGWQVETVDADGTASLSQTFDRIRVKVVQLNQPAVEYDS